MKPLAYVEAAESRGFGQLIRISIGIRTWTLAMAQELGTVQAQRDSDQGREKKKLFLDHMSIKAPMLPIPPQDLATNQGKPFHLPF